jgi:hypothetical protein
MQNKKLYDQWKLTEDISESTETIKYAFVTFRSMRGKEKCLQCFKYAEANAKLEPVEEDKMFFDKYLNMEHPVAPSSYKWENVMYSRCNRIVRAIIIWVIAVIMIFLALLLMIKFSNWNEELKANADPNRICPKDETHDG